MSRPCARRKLKNPRAKVSRRQAKPKRAISHPLPGWNPHATLDQNYEHLGIMHHLNKDLQGKELNLQVQQWLETRQEREEAEQQLHAEAGVFTPLPGEADAAELAALFPQPQRPEPSFELVKGPAVVQGKRLSADQRVMMERLRAKYGDDYQRMALDHRLNPLQHSAGRLAQLGALLAP